MSLAERRPRNVGPEEVISGSERKRKRDETKEADPKESRNDPDDRLVSSRAGQWSLPLSRVVVNRPNTFYEPSCR